MPRPEHPSRTPAALPPREVDRLELRVARRADQLARTRGQDRALAFWMAAEQRVLARASEWMGAA
ncbi:MAG TPA: hypothetical protein VHE13_01100 [Opitutus sp.]|nr:hypothetical protein [Opitutus sp.]